MPKASNSSALFKDEALLLYLNDCKNTSSNVWYFSETTYTSYIGDVQSIEAIANSLRGQITSTHISLSSPEGKELEFDINQCFFAMSGHLGQISDGIQFCKKWAETRYQGGVKAGKANMNIITRLFFNNPLLCTFTGSSCGVDQHALLDYVKNLNGSYDPVKHRELASYLSSTYNMSMMDAYRMIDTSDSIIGWCHYATLANIIIANYKDNPEQFEKDYGFPLYEYNHDGSKRINDVKLLSDIFIWYNTDTNGGTMFHKKNNGSSTQLIMDDNVYYRYLQGDEETENRTPIFNETDMLGDILKGAPFGAVGIIGACLYLDAARSGNSSAFNDYLSSHNSNIQTSWSVYGGINTAKLPVHKNNDNPSVDGIKDYLYNAFSDGYDIDLLINSPSGSTLEMKNTRTSQYYPVNGAHEMYVTSADNDGVYLSTWGDEYYISYNDLVKYNNFLFESVKINCSKGVFYEIL